MTLVALIGVALAAGAGALLTAGRRAVATAIGLAGSVIVCALAMAMPQDDSLAVGGAGLVGSTLIRSIALAWAAGLVIVGLIQAGVAEPPDETGLPAVDPGGHGAEPDVTLGPALIGLAATVLALASTDPQVSFAALSAGAVAGVAVPALNGWLAGRGSAVRLPTAANGSIAILGSGLLAIAVVAWAASGFGPLGGGAGSPGAGGSPGLAPEPALALGVALIAMSVAVVIRSGLIPAHVWAARFMEGVSPLAVPAAFTWGSAAFILVALDWCQVALGPEAVGDAERLLIVAIGLASVIMGGIAALIHDDVEHVLGYSILQDAGVAFLAFASLAPEAVDAARNWMIASAAIKTALTAWAAVTRASFGVHRLADLGGWARRAPLLGVAFVVAAAAAIGLPGMALFEARVELVTLAVAGPLGWLVLGLALVPLVYLGRVAIVGLGRLAPAVAASGGMRLALHGRRGWSGGSGWSMATARQGVALTLDEIAANRAPLMAIGVVVLALIGLALSIAGAAG